MAELVIPSVQYKKSSIEAVREAQAASSGLGDTLTWNVSEMEADFGAVLEDLRRYEPGRDLPDGFVHSDYRWLVEGDRYLGRVSLRHTLNANLRVFGGHIGYEIRPSARRQGYGTLALRLTLPRAQALGLSQVLVTCDADNYGSCRVIEANSGQLEDEVQLDFYDRLIRRYWIMLPGASGA
ncbi:GNAT family N-acetyltransferase (plasmid) [Deinococcus radiomollis]|uniref:GNAT family N-acetyltransferase n=1 Tax=Deinococcus radiomollis TaxID=468916 RepID=UPI00389279D4